MYFLFRLNQKGSKKSYENGHVVMRIMMIIICKLLKDQKQDFDGGVVFLRRRDKKAVVRKVVAGHLKRYFVRHNNETRLPFF